MVQFQVQRNRNKYKDAILNHNCIKLTVMNTNFVVFPVDFAVSSSVGSICLKGCVRLIMSTWAVCLSSRLWIAAKKWSLEVPEYFSSHLVQNHKPWITPVDPYKVPLVMLEALPRSREKSWHYKKKRNCLLCTRDWGLQLWLPTISR